MRKIVLTAIVSFVVTWAILKLLDAEMPEWMREQVNGL